MAQDPSTLVHATSRCSKRHIVRAKCYSQERENFNTEIDVVLG